jgi:hypothetical protein
MALVWELVPRLCLRLLVWLLRAQQCCAFQLCNLLQHGVVPLFLPFALRHHIGLC